MRLKDIVLKQKIVGLLNRDEHLRSLDCEYDVRGRVIHVTGTVPTDDDREYVRRSLAEMRGVEGVWDVLNTSVNGSLKVLDLGCGPNKQVSWAVGADFYPHEGVDLVVNAEKGLPFADNEFDYVFTIHFLEHIQDLFRVMNEIHRVLKPTGVLHAMVPSVHHTNAVADPTHVHFFKRQTFRYFCRPMPGLKVFKPICVSEDETNVLADLQPVKDGAVPVTEEELAYFFD